MLDRREFLAMLASAVAAAGSREAAAGAIHAQADVRRVANLGAQEKAYTFFNPTEIEFIEDAVARLIPNDELGPGALEADVPYYIDRVLATDYGSGSRFYNQGPFGATTPFQGYQSPLTPPQVYRAGIAATNRYCEAKYGKRFAELDAAMQDEVLKGLQGISGDLTLEDVPGTTFFSQLLTDTRDGFFSDPAYGGNRDMVGWKLVGYPGVPANYTTLIGKNEPYRVAPVDIRALQQARARLDEHGHAIHRRLDAREIPQTSAPPPPAGDTRTASGTPPQSTFFV
jgi:gluconate 2-dehydrogenase gamma chain